MLFLVEYAYPDWEVNKLAFIVSGYRGRGSIRKPQNILYKFFNKDGKANVILIVYDDMD